MHRYRRGGHGMNTSRSWGRRGRTRGRTPRSWRRRAAPSDANIASFRRLGARGRLRRCSSPDRRLGGRPRAREGDAPARPKAAPPLALLVAYSCGRRGLEHCLALHNTGSVSGPITVVFSFSGHPNALIGDLKSAPVTQGKSSCGGRTSRRRATSSSVTGRASSSPHLIES